MALHPGIARRRTGRRCSGPEHQLSAGLSQLRLGEAHMIRIDRVTTRGGDGGETSLGDGTRVAKDNLRVDAYGTIEEANTAIGLLRLHAPADADAMLARIQNDLFDIGADLCVPGEAGDRLRLTDAPSLRLEAEVAAMNAELAPLTSFLLPGGTPAAAH